VPHEFFSAQISDCDSFLAKRTGLGIADSHSNETRLHRGLAIFAIVLIDTPPPGMMLMRRWQSRPSLRFHSFRELHRSRRRSENADRSCRDHMFHSDLQILFISIAR